MAKTKPVSSQWSRASGGSGAPFWTLNACGLDPANFQATQGEEMYADRLVVGSDLRPLAKAAICHGSWNGNDGETPDEEWPDMVSPCISGLSVRRKLKKSATAPTPRSGRPTASASLAPLSSLSSSPAACLHPSALSMASTSRTGSRRNILEHSDGESDAAAIYRADC